MENYIKCEELGKGTFGVVFKAIQKQTGHVVAIKKIRLGQVKEGINVTALREIKLLRELHSPYIVRLLDVFPHKRNLLLVFEYCETDLELVIRDRSLIFGAADVKSYMQQILESVSCCHRSWLLHRDVKPNNFLIAPTGEVKLADFGLSRIFGSPDRNFTNQVCTRWYRAPELLYGSSVYGPAVDIWSVGCVFAELLLRRPWFPGNSDIDQLGKIYQALGTPTQEQWPSAAALPHYMEFNPLPAVPLRQTFRQQAGEDALDLLSRMVAFDPARRISAAQALQHRYFRQAPAPTPPSQLPRPVLRASAVLPQHIELNGGGVPPDSSNGGLPTPTVESSAAPSAGTGGEMEGEAVAGAELEGGVPSPPRSGFEALNNAGRRQSQSDSGEPRSGPSTALGRICLSTAQHRVKRSRLSGMCDSSQRPIDKLTAQHSTPSTGEAQPMSCDTGEDADQRPKCARGDMKYLRKLVNMNALFDITDAQDEGE